MPNHAASCFVILVRFLQRMFYYRLRRLINQTASSASLCADCSAEWINSETRNYVNARLSETKLASSTTDEAESASSLEIGNL